MESLYDQRFHEDDYIAVVVRYYDRASMRATTQLLPAHTHGPIEVMYVTAGQADIRLSDGIHTLLQDDLILLDAHVPHQLIIAQEDDFSMMNVEFVLQPAPGDGASLRSLLSRNQSLRAMLETPATYRIVHDCDEAVKNVMKQSVALCDSTHPQARELCNLLTSMLLLLIAHCAAVPTRQARDEESNAHVERALTVLRERDLAEPFSVDAWARQVGVSRTHLQRLFRQALSATPAERIRGARIARARELLQTTDLPVRRIAQLVGYNDAAHFARVYEKETGMGLGR